MDVRQQLIHVGVELLERDGLAALSLRRIAIGAGVSHGAPRHHFPTYANLLAEIAREGIVDLDRVITTGLSEGNPRTALMVTCRGVVDFAVRRPAMFELIARHDLLDGAGANLRTITGRWLPAVTAKICDVRPDGAEARAVALWAGVQGLGVMLGRRSAEAIIGHEIEPMDVLAVLVSGALDAPMPTTLPSDPGNHPTPGFDTHPRGSTPC